MKTENQFRDSKVRPLLNTLPFCFYFIKEALALRGYPDIMGCVNGRFFAWELKRSANEAVKMRGRIVLQKHILKKIRESGGVAKIVHPENLEECFQQLLRLSTLPNLHQNSTTETNI